MPYRGYVVLFIRPFLLSSLVPEVLAGEMQSKLRLRPPLVSDHLSSATSFPKYQKFPSQITIFGTSCERTPLVSDRDHF